MAAEESVLLEVPQEPSEAFSIVVDNNGAENIPGDEPGVLSSESVVSIEEKLEQPPRDDVECSSAKVSIYQIPHYLKVGDAKAYVPQIVSLGPYHHGEENLRPMDQHKSRCLHRILERSNHEISLYLDSVKEVEERARACYEGTISMSSDDFVAMMVLDGCFVIELFRGVDEGFERLGYPRNDPVFSNWGSMVKVQIQRDMIMLENQIPLFVLDRLLGLQLGDPDQKGRVAKLAIPFFAPLTRVASSRVEFEPSSNQWGLHCLEVFWQSLLPSGLRGARSKGWQQKRQPLIPCVTKLREAGTKFKVGITDRFGDIQFKPKNGILEIPQLGIHEGTRSLFLNLIAFEQSHFDCGNHITAYAIFMHNLINSPEDVDYLRNREIIWHCLGSNAEVADLFNRLCQEVAFDIKDSYLSDLSSTVDQYCRGGFIFYRGDNIIIWILAYIWSILRADLTRKWNAWGAILKNKYFDNPWSIISLIAAFVLLVLTLAQTFYAVYGYYWPRSSENNM